MWHMRAINKCISLVATTGSLFHVLWRSFAVAGPSFKATSLPLCIPLHSLAHFAVPKKFWKSAVWQSTIRRLLLKIWWWLTLERLLHILSVVYELHSNSVYPVMEITLNMRIMLLSVSVKLWTSVGHLSDLELMHWLRWHMLTSSCTLPLSVSLPSWLAWIFLLIPLLPLLLCCHLIIYRHAVTGQTPAAKKVTESESKNFIWYNCMKRNCKLAFSSIIDLCLQAMHNAGSRVYDKHVLNIMCWRSDGPAPTVMLYRVPAHMDSDVLVQRGRKFDREKMQQRIW